jgi:hypothetical protein
MLPGEFGATYVAVVAACALNVPLDAVQLTPAPATSLVTVAVKPKDCPSVNPPRTGDTVTLTGPAEVAAVTVIVAAADFVLSLTEVAVNVTVAGLGTLAGAVYVTAEPEALVVGATVPHAAPLQPAPDSVQVTPLAALSFVTVAVNDPVNPACTEAVVGDTVTEIGVGVGVPPPLSEVVDPPPQPFSNTTTTIANANTNRAARSIRTRAKGNLLSLRIEFFPDEDASAGLEAVVID